MVGISVIIPVYNREKYLPELIGAIKNQLTDNVEIIFVDDGSTDNSRKIIINAFNKFNNVKLIRIEHSGPGAARNRGLKEATKEYIWFVDSDDLIAPDAFLKLSEFIAAKEEKLELAIFDFSLEEQGKLNTVNLFDEAYMEFSKQESFELFLKNEFSNCVWNKLFRRDIIKENSCLFLEDITNGEDGIFILNYLEHVNKAVYSNNNFYMYRKNNDSLTTVCPAKILFSNYTVYNIKSRYIKDFSVDITDFDKKFLISNLNNIIRIINKNNSEKEIKEAYKYLISNKEIIKGLRKVKVGKRPDLYLIKTAVRFKNTHILYAVAKGVKKLIRLYKERKQGI